MKKSLDIIIPQHPDDDISHTANQTKNAKKMINSLKADNENDKIVRSTTNPPEQKT
jgi:hypothetical protein